MKKKTIINIRCYHLNLLFSSLCSVLLQFCRHPCGNRKVTPMIIFYFSVYVFIQHNHIIIFNMQCTCTYGPRHITAHIHMHTHKMSEKTGIHVLGLMCLALRMWYEHHIQTSISFPLSQQAVCPGAFWTQISRPTQKILLSNLDWKREVLMKSSILIKRKLVPLKSGESKATAK